MIFSCWNELRKSLDKAEDLEDIHLAHKQYLTLGINRCLLNPRAEKVIEAFRKILDLMLKFRVKVLSLSPYEDFGEAFQIFGVFRNYFQFVFKSKMKFLAYFVIKFEFCAFVFSLEEIGREWI